MGTRHAPNFQSRRLFQLFCFLRPLISKLLDLRASVLLAPMVCEPSESLQSQHSVAYCGHATPPVEQSASLHSFRFHCHSHNLRFRAAVPRSRGDTTVELLAVEPEVRLRRARPDGESTRSFDEHRTNQRHSFGNQYHSRRIQSVGPQAASRPASRTECHLKRRLQPYLNRMDDPTKGDIQQQPESGSSVWSSRYRCRQGSTFRYTFQSVFWTSRGGQQRETFRRGDQFWLKKPHTDSDSGCWNRLFRQWSRVAIRPPCWTEC